MKIGSLCSGIGGLDLGLPGEVAWHVEYDANPSKVLAAHYPDVPNYGDLTTVEWDNVEPVDLLTAGYPCQPFSAAGKRKGTNDDRHVFPYVAQAIRHLRPPLVVLENVYGHLSLGFGEVLGALAAAGYDTRWCCLRASEVGAPHRRERVFILATGANVKHGDGRRQKWGAARRGEPADGGSRAGDGLTLLPTPTARDYKDGPPCANVEINSLLGRAVWQWADGAAVNWGEYEPAIRRWEELTRPAPAPTDGKRLSPAFVEWMMGYPEGWVTGLDLSRAGQLKALGNAVVPAQAAAAWEMLT